MNNDGSYGISINQFTDFLGQLNNHFHKIEQTMDAYITDANGFCINISKIWYSPRAVEYMSNEFSPRYLNLEKEIDTCFTSVYHNLYTAFETWANKEGIVFDGAVPYFKGNILTLPIDYIQQKRSDGFVGIIDDAKMHREIERFDELSNEIKVIFNNIIADFESSGILLYGSNQNHAIVESLRNIEAVTINQLNMLKENTFEQLEATINEYKQTAENVASVIANSSLNI